MNSHYDSNQPGQYQQGGPVNNGTPHLVGPPPRKRRAGKIVLIVVGVCTLGIIGVVSCTAAMFNGAINAADNAPHVQPTDPEPGPAVPTTKPVEKAPARGVHDGTLFVGKDVLPGTYVTTVPADSLACYWARLKDTDGELGSVIANKLGEPGGQMVLTIKKTDYAVEVRCDGAKWTKR